MFENLKRYARMHAFKQDEVNTKETDRKKGKMASWLASFRFSVRVNYCRNAHEYEA